MQLVRPAGMMAMIVSIIWRMEEVFYIGEGHTIKAAKGCSGQNKCKIQRQHGFVVPIRIHSANAHARQLFKEKKIAHRIADGEGENMTMAETLVVTQKLEATSSPVKAGAAILEKKQRSDWQHPLQRAKPCLKE